MTSQANALLGDALNILDDKSGATSGTSARLAAFLARQAVEEMITARCTALVGRGVEGATVRSQIAILKSLDETPLGSQLMFAWYQLSAFCHHHAYELSPTASEIKAVCASLPEAGRVNAIEQPGIL